MDKVLITGGAGFIGCKVGSQLLEQGAEVVVLDSMSPQIHPNGQPSKEFEKLLSHVNFIKTDICDRERLHHALDGVTGVVHLAAETGTGQSMYEIERYVRVNDHGTAVLLEEVAKHDRIESVVVASSRAIYGEGKYVCGEHGNIYPKGRSAELLNKGEFDFSCPYCGDKLTLVGTDESTPVSPKSIYGLTKYCQESLTLQFGETTGKRVCALRYQNVFGPGQSLSNPYTGILAIFSTRLRQNKEIYIFEDGLESRDFVFVDDAARATVLALKNNAADRQAINVGTGVAVSVMEVAQKLRRRIAPDVKISITGEYRLGDIRHNFADTRKAKELLGFEARVNFDAGLDAFLDWALASEPGDDGYERSLSELRDKGLLVK